MDKKMVLLSFLLFRLVVSSSILSDAVDAASTKACYHAKDSIVGLCEPGNMWTIKGTCIPCPDKEYTACSNNCPACFNCTDCADKKKVEVNSCTSIQDAVCEGEQNPDVVCPVSPTTPPGVTTEDTTAPIEDTTPSTITNKPIVRGESKNDKTGVGDGFGVGFGGGFGVGVPTGFAIGLVLFCLYLKRRGSTPGNRKTYSSVPQEEGSPSSLSTTNNGNSATTSTVTTTSASATTSTSALTTGTDTTTSASATTSTSAPTTGTDTTTSASATTSTSALTTSTDTTTSASATTSTSAPTTGTVTTTSASATPATSDTVIEIGSEEGQGDDPDGGAGQNQD